MPIIQLIHWNEKEAHLRSLYFQSQGNIVYHTIPSGKKLIKQIADNHTEIIIISLERLPSQGRDIALWLRKNRTTRTIPIAFVEGTPTKVAAIKSLLPDAVFHSWKTISSSVGDIIASAPTKPHVPASLFAAYSQTPLHKKMGVKSGMRVCMLDAPADETLRTSILSNSAELCRDPENADITLCFVTTKSSMITYLASLYESSNPVWFCWPKRTAKMNSELTQQIVRELGLAAGFVDYKICSINPIWSGLLFRRRKINA